MENSNYDFYYDEELYYDEEEDDISGNMPCDFTGFCGGTSCPNFFKCKGGK